MTLVQPDPTGQIRSVTDRQLRAVIETIPGLVWLAGIDGAAEYLNRRWLEYTGLSQADAAGPGWTGAIHPDDLDRLINYWRSLLQSEVRGQTEARLRRFDGEYRWFMFTAEPVRDESGAVTGWCGTNLDIDDRRRAEDAVRDDQRELGLIVDSIPGLVFTLFPSGELEFVNRRVQEYFGRTLAELKQWPTSDVFHPEDLPWVIPARKRALEAGVPSDIEAHRLRRADGVYRWFTGRGHPVRDADGRIVRCQSSSFPRTVTTSYGIERRKAGP